MMDSKYKAAAVFGGIGGFCLGFARHGIPTEWAIENEENAVKSYKENIKGATVLKNNGQVADIRDVSVSSFGLKHVDVLHAGFPCQSFSQAGNRKGFDDPRGQLFHDLIRIINEFGEDRPKVLVFENSPYLRYGQSGRWLDIVSSCIRKSGYWFRESNCVEVDLAEVSSSPQRRNRLFMLAFATNRFKNGRFSMPKMRKEVAEKDLSQFISFEDEQDDGYYLDPDNRYYKMISEHADEERRLYQLRKYEVRKMEKGVCPTLTANMGLGGHNIPFIFDKKGLRKLTEYECLALQGFPDNFMFPEDVPRYARYVQIGNSVSPLVASTIAETVLEKLEGSSTYV